MAIEVSRPFESSKVVVPKKPVRMYEYLATSLAGQVPRLPHVLTDTICTCLTTWTTCFRFHYTVLLISLQSVCWRDVMY